MKKGCNLFNDNWQFALTDADADRAALDGAKWYNVEIPHDWLIGDTNNLYKSGCGWYKKTFSLTAEEAADSFIICFDGVYMDSTVYVNGSKAGEWKNGYTSFSFDITEYIKEGDNEILVRVNHKHPNSRWYSGAGIYRNVYMRRTSADYIITDGVYFSAKAVGYPMTESSSRWKVMLDTELNRDFDGQVRHTLVNADGQTAAEICGPVVGAVHRTEFFIDTPKLWNPDSPNLYTLHTYLMTNDGETLDETSCRVGFRNVRFDPASGLYLNGRRIKLNGVCLHHDLGALGAAVNKDAIRRQLEKLIGMGVNAIRTAHNPHSRELIELCDELGLLVNCEFSDVWEEAKTEYDYSRFFPEWYKTDVKAWVTRDRNHPCVIMWSIGNEIHDTHKSERGLEVAKALSDEVKLHDRRGNAKPTIGSNYMAWDNAKKVADHLKIIGYNYAERLYKEHHALHHDWVIYGSETASTVRSRGVYHFPYNSPQLTHDDMQCSDLGNSVVNWGASPFYSYRMDRDCKFSMGQFVWTGFDYIGEPTPYNSKNSYFGIIDTAGFPKESYWFYKSVWDKKAAPFIHLMPHMDYNEGQLIDVIAYSNLPTLTLTVNDQPHKTQHIDLDHGDRFCAHWQIKYSKDDEVKVYGYTTVKIKDKDDWAVCETLASFGEPKAIKLSADKTAIKADGRSLSFIEISVTDENGNEVANANDRVKLTVSGAGRLVGTDNGDSTDYDSYKNDNRRLFSGKLLAIVQATLDSGTITVTAEGAELESASVTITAEPCEKPDGISVVTENVFPAVTTEYKPEKPVRKIELIDENTDRTFDPEHTERKVKVKLHPADADYSDIVFKCSSSSGEEVNFVEVTDYDGEYVSFKAKGDGDFRLRAIAKNGSDIPKVISELEYSITGMGSAVIDAYQFTAATLCNYTNVTLNNIGNGSFGLNGRSVTGFYSMDFGKAGADSITISVGNCNPDPVYAKLYVGDPDNGGRYVGDFLLEYNNGWDKASPQVFKLPEIIKGLNDIYIEIDSGLIYGGIGFGAYNRAYMLNYAADCDKLYGDDYEVADKRVNKIGNNVVIEFNALDFGEGATSLTITGRTPLDVNTIQLRTTDSSGTQKTQILEFPHADDFTAVKFDIEKVSGVNDVSFVFLPGVKFDMESFEFNS
ncbi:MAG: beta-galactosidase [Eubacterium sp.]|nr:beta-galactosidase [Eubacterium sp.]